MSKLEKLWEELIEKNKQLYGVLHSLSESNVNKLLKMHFDYFENPGELERLIEFRTKEEKLDYIIDASDPILQDGGLVDFIYYAIDHGIPVLTETVESIYLKPRNCSS